MGLMRAASCEPRSSANLEYSASFTICLFISPDLDGHRAPKMKYCPTETQKRLVITWSDGLEIRLGKRVYYGKGPS